MRELCVKFLRLTKYVVCCRRKIDLRNISPGFSISMVFVWVPLFTTTVMLLLRIMGNNSLAVSIILIPMWVIGALLLCVPLSLVAVRRRAHHLQNEDEQIILSLVMLYCITLPWVTFEILLAIHDETPEKISARATFAPVIAWLGILAVGFLLHGIAAKFIGPSTEYLPI